jgi:hypothetical protein
MRSSLGWHLTAQVVWPVGAGKRQRTPGAERAPHGFAHTRYTVETSRKDGALFPLSFRPAQRRAGSFGLSYPLKIGFRLKMRFPALDPQLVYNPHTTNRPYQVPNNT